MRKNILVTSLGIKAIALSMGSVALSLGLNLVGLDNNQAQAGAGLNNIANSTSGTVNLINTSLNTQLGKAVTVAGTDVSVVGYGTNVPVMLASEIFGSNSASTVIPSDGTNKLAAYYQFDGKISVTFLAKFALDNGAVFDTDPVACLNNDPSTIACSALALNGTSGSNEAGGAGKNYAVFKIQPIAANSIGSDSVAGATDHIVLSYKIKSANALATPGSKIQMTATMRTPEPGYDVNPSSTIPIVESKQAVTVTVTADTGSEAEDDRITVVSEGLEFSYTRAVNQAKIGNLKITNTATASAAVAAATHPTIPHTPDGFTAWEVGKTGATIDSAKSNFTITGGQFAASITSPGKVELADTGNDGKSYTSKLSTQATDSETAVFKLDSSNVQTITSTSASLTKGTDIFIVADGKNAVNLVENAPVGQVTITYATTSYQATTFPAVELKRIKQDGTRCVIYNVPAPGSADIVAIRITNDSGVDGIVNATLYDGDGNEIFPATALNDGNSIESGETLAVFAEHLAKLGTWTGRGVLVLTTELPSMEVLGLLREAGNNSAPLTNLSTGATGSGCTN